MSYNGHRDVIGFIGLGNLGSCIAQRTVAAGFEVIVWNRTESKMEPLCLAGASSARSAAELGERADVLFTCVDSPDAMVGILFGPEGVVHSNVRVSLVVDHSTLSPRTEQALGKRLGDETDIGLIDVPLSGGASGALAGTLAAMAGGDRSLVERAEPVMASYTSHVTHMGPLGAGQATKACNQIISCLNIAAVAEVLILGKSCGIDTSMLPDAVDGGFGDSAVIREYNRSLHAADSSAIRIMIDALSQEYSGVPSSEYHRLFDLVLKDLAIAMEIGQENGSATPMTTYLNGIIHSLRYQQGPPARATLPLRSPR